MTPTSIIYFTGAKLAMDWLEVLGDHVPPFIPAIYKRLLFFVGKLLAHRGRGQL